MVEAILASRPRFVVVADRRIHYVCEQADRWRAVDAALSTAYRRVAHSRGAVDSFDVYEALSPAPRSGAVWRGPTGLAVTGDG